MAGEISVGAAATSRDAEVSEKRTYIMGAFLANVSGVLTDIELSMSYTLGADSSIGIFELVSGTTFRCRSAQNVGAVSAGYNEKALSPHLNIREGDYIGWYGNDSMERLFCDSGESQVYYLPGNHCVVDDENAYALYGDRREMSLHGIGDHVPAGEFGIVV